MFIQKELANAFSQLHSMIIEDQSEELLTLTYAEFTLKCFIVYNEQIRRTILHADAPLPQAFCALGVDQPNDWMSLLLISFYFHLHTDKQNPC